MSGDAPTCQRAMVRTQTREARVCTVPAEAVLAFLCVRVVFAERKLRCSGAYAVLSRARRESDDR